MNHYYLAYIDAGSGSYLFQFLIAGFVAALYAIKLFWRRLTGFCSRLISSRKSRHDNERA